MLPCMQAANVPLDQRQLEWLIKKFDENCTATIIYRLVCNCCVCIHFFVNKKHKHQNLHKITSKRKIENNQGFFCWTKMISFKGSGHPH